MRKIRTVFCILRKHLSKLKAGDNMFYANIHKFSFKINKSKYLKSMCIPLFLISTVIIFCIMPFIINLIFNMILLKIPDKYSLLCSVTKSILILLSGYAACVFYSTVSIGEEAWYSGKLMRKKNCYKRFIYWFRPRSSFKAFRLKSALFFLKLFWSLVFLLPSALLFSVIFITAFSGGIETYFFLSLFSGAVILLIIGLVFRFIMIQRYFLARFIMAENPNNKVLQTIRQSKNLLDGQLFTIVKFKLTFLPFYLLCFLVLPIFFVYPHYKQSRSILAKELMI